MGKSRPPRLLLPLLVSLVLVGACAAPAAPPSSAPTASPAPATPTVAPSPTGAAVTASPSVPPPSPSPSPSPSETTAVRVYFLIEDPAGGDPALVPVQRQVSKSQAVVAAALRELVAGPSAAEQAASPRILSVVPAGTELLGVRIADGLATVNLSNEFQSGGGSMEMFGRLAQVVYTVTQFPTVTRVSFELDGLPVTVFSGEGIVLDEPVTRATYRDDWLPAIFVDRPAWGAALGHPGRVAGLANVFEATFRLTVLDRDGAFLVERQVMASCGTGCWGTFDVTLDYAVTTPQWGTLRAWDASPEDGHPENVREYPVWLTSAP